MNDWQVRWPVWGRPIAAIAAAVALASCTAPTPTPGEQATADGTASPAASPAASDSSLTVRANGEAFVQEGLTSRDGWQITFDRVIVGIQDVVAYQTEPPFDAQAAAPLTPQVSVPIPTAEPVNLKGAEGAELPAVGTAAAAAGRYNALSWHLAPTVETEGGNRASILLAGEATKEGRTVPFTIAVDPDLRFECGDYVGDERKGIVTADGGELEITLHFDHWFGDGSLAADNPMNQESLGFEPLAALAQGDRLTLEPEAIAQLPAPAQETLTEVFSNLAHVGEGHCRLREN